MNHMPARWKRQDSAHRRFMTQPYDMKFLPHLCGNQLRIDYDKVFGDPYAMNKGTKRSLYRAALVAVSKVNGPFVHVYVRPHNETHVAVDVRREDGQVDTVYVLIVWEPEVQHHED